jgi:hypothetical protein
MAEQSSRAWKLSWDTAVPSDLKGQVRNRVGS